MEQRAGSSLCLEGRLEGQQVTVSELNLLKDALIIIVAFQASQITLGM